MKEIVRRAIELLKDKNYSRVCLDLTEVNWEELRRRIIEILTDKRGELGIPKDKVEAIAEMILPDIIVTREQITCWLEHFRTFDTNKFEHRRRFIDTFVNRIFLYDDKMVITFNYNKGTKTITFAELEASGILSISNIASTGEPTKRHTPCGVCLFVLLHYGEEPLLICLQISIRLRSGN